MMMSWANFVASLPSLYEGALRTIGLVGFTLVLGFLIALPVALARNSRVAAARWFAYIFVFVFRGAPLLVLLYLIYYGIPQFDWIRQSALWPLLREPYVCAVLALSLNSAGYLTEILAGAIRAVPRGEVEAATAAGYSRFDRFRHIIAPHAARIVLRAYGNEIVFVIKGTSVASLVTIIELMGAARAVYFRYYDPFTPLLAAAAIYLVMVFLLMRAIRFAEIGLTPELRVERWRLVGAS